MFKIHIIWVWGLIIGLAACTTGSTVVTGPVTAAMDMTKVQVVYQSPSCHYEAVAHIEFSGGFFSRAALIDGFRQKAAELGAGIVQVLQVQPVGSNEYFGSARALRCL